MFTKTLSIGVVFAIVLASAAPAQARTETPIQEVGKIYTKTIYQEFGKQEVLAATIDRDPTTNADFIYVEVEGMPCVVYHPSSNRGGFTCDWTRWEGRSFSEAQKPHPTEVQNIIDDYKKSQIKFPESKSVGVMMQ